jgi:protein-tyrosine phosphatase
MRSRIETLAEGLHVAATVDGTAGEASLWPFDEKFHAWWVERGRILAGEYPGSPHGDRDEFKLTSLADAGIDTIIDLTRDVDGLSPYGRAWTELGRWRGRDLKRLHYPIIDCSVTTPERYDAMVADIERDLAAGRGVYIHCWGGVGRTGTVVGCWHVARGHSASEALAKIAAARQGTRKANRDAPETPSQVDMIHEMAGRGEQSTRRK